MKCIYIILSFLLVCCLSACDNHKKKAVENVKRMQSTPITLSFNKMVCWSEDYLGTIDLCKGAKLKLVHYIDSAQCTTCYLQSVVQDDNLLRIEKASRNQFINVFVIEPGERRKKILQSDYKHGLLPKLVFVDTAHVFVKENSNIPEEIIYHTFLLDENDRVLLVGNPLTNENVHNIFLHIINEKFKINVSKK